MLRKPIFRRTWLRPAPGVSTFTLFLFLLALSTVPCLAQKDGARTIQTRAAVRREVPAFGRIEITTNPGSYPVLVDGQPAGTTAGPAARLLDLAPGRHTVEVIFPNGRRWTREFNVVAGRRQCVALNYKPQEPCIATIAAPGSVGDGEVITFAADVSYYGKRPLTYTWTVTPATARIIGGQGTPTLRVDSTGLGRQSITAVLNVSDKANDPLCLCEQTARGATTVLAPAPPPIQPRRFDEFISVSFDDDKARLDNFAIELQNNPGATGYVVIYGARAGRPGEAARLGARSRSYLVGVRGIDAGRVVVVNGGAADRNYFELFIVPRGAPPPQPGRR